MKPILWLAVGLVAVLPALGADRESGITQIETVTVTTTIESIDRDNHTVTLRDREGHPVTLYADADMDVLDRLAVGDEVTFRYVAPVILEVHTLDDPGASGGSRGQTFRGTRWTPAGMPSARMTERVTVREVDPQGELLTFETEDGGTMTLPVDHGSLVKGLHAGDAIDITYTLPILLSVE